MPPIMLQFLGSRNALLWCCVATYLCVVYRPTSYGENIAVFLSVFAQPHILHAGLSIFRFCTPLLAIISMSLRSIANYRNIHMVDHVGRTSKPRQWRSLTLCNINTLYVIEQMSER